MTISEYKSFCFLVCDMQRVSKNFWTNLVYFLPFYFDLPANIECSFLWTVVFRSAAQFKVSIMAVVFQVHFCSSVSRFLLQITNVILIFPPSPMTVSESTMYVMARILHPDLVYHWVLLGILTRMVMGVSTKKLQCSAKVSSVRDVNIINFTRPQFWWQGMLTVWPFELNTI